MPEEKFKDKTFCVDCKHYRNLGWCAKYDTIDFVNKRSIPDKFRDGNWKVCNIINRFGNCIEFEEI